MKKRLVYAMFLATFLVGTGCMKYNPLIPPRSHPGSPTSTPTPVCGFEPVALGKMGIQLSSLAAFESAAAGVPEAVIILRDLDDWEAFCAAPTGFLSFETPTPTPYPTPPVDFSTQNLLIQVSSICPQGASTLSSVCVEANAVNVTFDVIQYCVWCNAASSVGSPRGFAIPKSEKPFSWNVVNHPCVMPGS